jgi:hypothetical protein
MISFGSIISDPGVCTFYPAYEIVRRGEYWNGIIAQNLTGTSHCWHQSLALTAGQSSSWSTRKLGKSFGAKSIYATIMMNVLIDFFNHTVKIQTGNKRHFAGGLSTAVP